VLAALYREELYYQHEPEKRHDLWQLLKLMRQGLLPNRTFDWSDRLNQQAVIID
jgi:hypothetical protein